MDQPNHTYRVSEYPTASSSGTSHGPHAVAGRTSPLAARQRRLLDIAILAAIAVGMWLLVSFYLSREHTFYIADAYFWPTKTTLLARHYHELLQSWSPSTLLELVRELWVSTLDDYNEFYSLPLAPFLMAFGYSRHTYIATVALVYTLPLALAVGALSAQVVPEHRRAAFWLGTALTALNPVVWATTLRGYPDSVAALMFTLAILAYGYSDNRRSTRYLLLTGFLLAVTLLLRRHYVYLVAAFLLAVLLWSLHDVKPSVGAVKFRMHYLMLKLRPVCIIAGSAFFGLIALGLPFLYTLFTTDYERQYGGYLLSPEDTFWFYLTRLGWPTWVAATAGFAVVFLTTKNVSSTTATVALTAAFTAVLWVTHARQSGVHHALQFLPFVTVGMVALLYTMYCRLRGPACALLTCAVTVFVLANCFVSAGFMESADSTFLTSLFSAPYRPLVRDDYDEVTRIVEYLRGMVGPDERIYVLDAGSALSSNTLVSAEGDLHGDDRSLRLAGDLFQSSLSAIYQANYVVVPMAVRYSPSEACSQARSMLAAAFRNGSGIGSDFTPELATFVLGDGDGYPQGMHERVGTEDGADGKTVVQIYRRWRASAFDIALMALNQTKGVTSHCDLYKQDWMVLASAPNWTYADRHNRYQFSSSEAPVGDASAILVYLPVVQDNAVMDGRVKFTRGDCQIPNLDVIQTDADYHFIGHGTVYTDGLGGVSLALTPAPASTGQMLLRIGGEDDPVRPIPYCGTGLELNKAAESGPVLARWTGRLADAVRARIHLSR